MTYTGNTVEGANQGFQWLGPPFNADFSAHDPVVVTANTLTDVETGFLIRSNGAATLTNNVFTNATTAISLDTGSAGRSSATENSFVGSSTAVHNMDTVAFDASGNWWGSTDETAISNLMIGPVDFTPFLANGMDQALGMPGFQGDFSSLFVTALGEQTSTTGRIQEGVNRVDANGTVNVLDGTYIESNITIDKAVTIDGESEAGVLLAPAAEDDQDSSRFGGTFQQGFLIQSSDVTIQDLSLDGQGNPLLTSGKNNYRVGIVSDDRISANFDNLIVQNVTIANPFLSGIEVRNDGTGHVFDANVISNVEFGIQASPFVVGYGILTLADAEITNNQLTDIGGRGIGLAIASGTISGNTVNGTHSGLAGIYLNNFGAPAAIVSVTGNLIQNVDRGIHVVGGTDGTTVGGPNAADANTIDLTGLSSAGIGIINQYNVGAPLFQNNQITASGPDSGFWLFHNESTATAPTLQTNTITTTGSDGTNTGEGTGVFLTEDGTFFGDENGASFATLLGNTITGFARGVDLFQNAATPAGGRTIDVTIGGTEAGDLNAITGGGTGVRVLESNPAGARATATFLGVTNISGNTTGMEVDGGVAIVNGTIDDDGMINGSADMVIVQNSGLLQGTGTMDAAVDVESTGTVAPGTSTTPGQLSEGDTDFGSGSHLDVVIGNSPTFTGFSTHPPVAGTDSSQLIVNGTVTISNTASLNLFDNLGTSNSANNADSLILIDNDGADDFLGDGVFGTLTIDGSPAPDPFGDLGDGEVNNGDRFTFNGQTWRIYYNGGDGNDLVMVYVDTSSVYVNDDFAGLALNDLVPDADPNTPGDQAAIFGITAFATIQEGVNAVDANGTVLITDDIDGANMSPNAPTTGDGPGIYNELVTIAKDLTVQTTELDPSAARIDGDESGNGGVALSGSLVTIQAGATVTIDSLTLQDGSATNGGGINSFGNLTLRNSTVQNNSATSAGGGVLQWDGGSLTIDGSTIDSNVSSLDGGGVYVRNASALIQNRTLITGNAAADQGGGLFQTGDGSGSVTVKNSTIQMNEAGNDGGGVFNVNNATMSIQSSLISRNSAGRNGGGIWTGHDTGTGAFLTISDSDITLNTASGASATEGGGGIYIEAGTVTISGGSTLQSNLANGNAGSGGGIFLLDGDLDVSNTEIQSNTANRAGGGVEIVDGTADFIGDANLRFNSVNGTEANPGNGGGLHVSGTSGTVVTVNNSIVENNVAANEGGGLWNQSGSTLNIIATQIIANTANGTGGGGIFNNGGSVMITPGASPSTIDDNQALGTSSSGGGVLSNGGSVIIDASGGLAPISVTGNVANGDGGGIAMTGGSLTLDTVTLDGNSAGEGGGWAIPRQRGRNRHAPKHHNRKQYRQWQPRWRRDLPR